MKKQIIALLAGTMLTLGAAAQRPAPIQYQFGGLAFNHDLMSSWDFGDISRTQQFGTSRAMAMGSAFVSLGADLSSMAINPAGLGMYRSNELSITPVMDFARATTADTEAGLGSNHRNVFALGNFGAAINVHQDPTSAVTSVTVGFGMNRIADFNRRYSYSTALGYNPESGAIPSIADLYAHQLQWGEGGYPVFPNAGHGVHNPNGRLDFNGVSYFWPAVLAYKSALTHVTGWGDNRQWERDAIGENASMRRTADVINKGSINEFSLSAGINIRNIVYIGATIGVQSVNKSDNVIYSEDYYYAPDQNGNEIAYAPDGRALPAQLEYADIWQRSELSGAGINIKLGVIVRPVAGLRLGAAFHSPTYYTLDRSYNAGINYKLYSHEDQRVIEEGIYSPTQYDEMDFSWDFTSPARLMFGASYTFGRMAIISVDYERAWYNGIRVHNAPGGNFTISPAQYKYDIRNSYCATNTVRGGVEIKPISRLAIRFGGGYQSSMLADGVEAIERPQTTESYYFTGGIGIRLSHRISLDAAYQQLTEHQSAYALFYEYNPYAGAYGLGSDLYETSFKRHFASLTLSYKF